MSQYADRMTNWSSVYHRPQQSAWDAATTTEASGYFTSAAVFLGGCVLGAAILICFATGLVYIAELAEEYTKKTKKFLSIATKATVALNAILYLVDGMPLIGAVAGIAAQVSYTQLLRDFPFVPLDSPKFIMSAVMLIVNHFVWMEHFLQTTHSMEWIVSFFFIVVWLVPFALMMSIASTDSMLPGAGNPVKINAPQSNQLGSHEKGRSTKSAALRIFSYLKTQTSSVLPQATSAAKGHTS